MRLLPSASLVLRAPPNRLRSSLTPPLSAPVVMPAPIAGGLGGTGSVHACRQALRGLS